MANQSMEVAVMFIRNCPNKDLSLVFMSKPQRDWTASEVQERLDEFLGEHRESRGQLSQHIAATVDLGVGSIASRGCPSVKFPVGGCEPECTASEENTLERELGMFEKALVCNTQSVSGERYRRGAKRPMSCRVCQSTDHSTNAHCRLHRLCFQCYAPGHTREQCQANTQSRVPTAVQTAQSELREY